ncbi:MAG: hypothetical protein ACYTAF_01000 [Planctomycetota bacterium]|jgi:hypothetical protein
MDGETRLKEVVTEFLGETINDALAARIVRARRRPRTLLGRLMALLTERIY